MSFVKVADASALAPGANTTITHGGRDYALFNIDGAYYCLDNECPHHAGPLGEGDVEDDFVICPWHAWQINIKTGETLYMPSLCVATHACKVEDDAVWVDL